MAEPNIGTEQVRKPCRWFHRWPPVEQAEWLGGIAAPAFQFTCTRCGATKVRRYGA